MTEPPDAGRRSLAGVGSRLTVRAHAKINLSLEVVGVRSDGYHLLKTVFQSIALHDLLTFEACDGPFTLACSAPEIPTDERNLVWRAAAMLWEAAGREGAPVGARATITKRVPSEGGLGGGSADAAAALVALDALWETGVGEATLGRLARRLGADVPFFLCGGTVLGLDRGDELYPLEDLDEREIVLVFPPFGVSTPEAFRWYDEDVGAATPTPEAHERLQHAAGWPALRLGHVGLPVVNGLEAPVGRRHPEIPSLCRRLAAAGAEASAMTGSGSTVFGLFTKAEAAASASAALEAEGWRTLVTRTARRREVQRALRPGDARIYGSGSSRIN